MTVFSGIGRYGISCIFATLLAMLPVQLVGAEENTVRVLRSPVGGFQGLFIANEQGYFKKRGLKVEITVGGGPAQNIAQLQAGQTDIAQVGAVDLVAAVSQGLPVIAVLNAFDFGEVGTTGLLTLAASPLKTVADFKGKKLGVPFAAQSVQGLMVYRAFEKAGLSPADASLVNLPFDTLIESAENGIVDAIAPAGLFYPAALSKGFVEVEEFYEKIHGVPAALFAARSDWTSSNDEALAAFVEAMQEAYDYANAHPEAVRAVDAAQTRQPPDYIANRYIAPFTGAFRRDVWMAMVGDMHKYGIIPNAPAEADFIWSGAPR